MAIWSSEENGGWGPGENGGDSRRAAMEAARRAAEVVLRDGGPRVDISQLQLRFTQTVTAIDGVGATTTALGWTDRVELPREVPGPLPMAGGGKLELNRQYQRYGLGVRGRAFVDGSVRMRAILRSNGRAFPDSNTLLNQPSTTSSANRRIPKSGRHEFPIQKVQYDTAVQLQRLWRASNGRVQGWDVQETDQLGVYEPKLTSFRVETPDELAKADGIVRTRADRSAVLHYRAGGFRQEDGDPGDLATNVFVYRQGQHSWGYRTLNQGGLELMRHATFSDAVRSGYDRFRRPSDNALMGFRTNAAHSVLVAPEVSFGGTLATDLTGPATYVFGTAFKGVRAENNWNKISRDTAYQFGWQAPLQVWPRASGQVEFSGARGPVRFDQFDLVTLEETLTLANNRVTATLSNPYPNSFALLAVGPDSGDSPPVQLDDNYPSGAPTLSGDLQSYLSGRPNGFYWLTILGYTSVDRSSLGSAIDPAFVPRFASGNDPSPVGGAAWNHPTKGRHPFGWVRLGAIRFYYRGTMTVAGSIVTER